ncbi:hypothetical protein ATW55_04535 [Ferroacidibacillus organovorans]|uniref:Uncharacterized protein n=1 Tax=Ferroacidibacillus organovorans TaxID=1765683 RepID=A0A101XTI3_9BACL|nr:hypothetical protein ATW55_04535 [Ferroacidibacillus organovorans]
MYLLVGTAKGLFRFKKDQQGEWRALEPVLLGDPVYTSAYDPTTGTIFAGVNSEFYGPSIRRSRDGGERGIQVGADFNMTRKTRSV